MILGYLDLDLSFGYFFFWSQKIVLHSVTRSTTRKVDQLPIQKSISIEPLGCLLSLADLKFGKGRFYSVFWKTILTFLLLVRKINQKAR